MAYTCLVCKEEYNYLDEVNHYNVNGEQVANDEQTLERNCQNPDYAVHCICGYCDEAREDYELDLLKERHMVLLRKLVALERMS